MKNNSEKFLRFTHLIFWVCTGLHAFAGEAPAYELGGGFESNNLIGFVSTYSTVNNLSVRDVIKLNEFKHSPEVPSFDADFRYHWLKIRIDSRESKNLIIEYQQIFIDDISFYLFENDSLIKQANSTWKKKYISKSFPGRYHAFLFPVEEKKSYTVLLKCHNTETEYSNRGFVKLFDKSVYQKETDMYLIQICLSVGCLIFVALLSFGFFFYSRKRIYVFYLCYITSMCLYILVVNGILNQFTDPETSFPAQPEFGSVLVVLIFIFHALYVNEFFKIANKGLIFALRVFVIACVFQVILLVFVPHAHIPFSVIYILFAILVIWALVSNIRRNKKSVYLYLTASGPLFLTFLAVILGAIGLTGINTFFYYHAHIPLALEGLGLGLALLYVYNDERINIERELEINRQETTHKILFAQEEERQRLARDLHDDLGGSLSVLNRELDEYNRQFDGVISDSVNLTIKIVDDLRLISHQLMPSFFSEKGLLAVTKESVELANRQNKIKFYFFSNGQERRLHPESEINVYRIIKELINNVLKHSEATESTLQLIYFEEFLYFSIEDNGKGFQINPQSHWGIGFRNIHLRTSYLKAKLNMESGLSGSFFSLEIPYNAAQNKDITS